MRGARSTGESVVVSSSVACSSRWNAPELQVDPRTGLAAATAPTTSSDVWAFATTAWEIITGRIPYADFPGRMTEGRIAYKIFNEGATPAITPLDRAIPPALVCILEQCWSKVPESRPSMATVAELFTAFMTSQVSAASSSLLGERRDTGGVRKTVAKRISLERDRSPGAEPQAYSQMGTGQARFGKLGLMPFESPPVSMLDLSSGLLLRRFEPYVEMCGLGSGSFGEAFLAHHCDRPNHLVVLKVVQATGIAQADEASRLLRSEASLLRTLHHPRVVRFLDLVENHDRAFIVMAYITGGSLTDKLRTLPDSRLPAPKVARLLLDVLQALEHVHSKGVMHLDVK